MSNWDELSLRDKAEFIKVGVRNGFTSISDIKEQYNKFDEGGYKNDYVKPWYWFTPEIEASSLKEAIFKAYDEGKEGETFLYKGGAYKAKLSDSDLKEYKIKKQHELNRNITNEQVVDSYINNAMYTFENPTSKGYKNGKWYPYTDKDISGNTHYNIGPGIESNSDMGDNLNYTGSIGYTTDYLNSLVREDLLLKMRGIRSDLHDMYDENTDTMSLGNRMILLDIAHNVAPRGKKKGNMPKAWPSLIGAMVEGDSKRAIKEMYSGSTRRRDMRSDLLWQNEVTPETVKNR